MAIELQSDTLDFTTLLLPGEYLAWGQASAEPTTLTARLFEQSATIPGLRAFVGMSWGTPFTGAEAMRFQSYCGAGHNRALERAGALDILPCHYSDLPALLARQVDVLLLNLADDGNGRFSFGAALEYLAPLVDSARLVIAEVNTQTPWSCGERTLSADDIDIIVRTSRPPVAGPGGQAGHVERAIAARVAGLVEDGATLQIGIGGLPEAILAALVGHRDLGLHSGLASDGVAGLAEAGALTNARKSVDVGIAVAGLVAGGPQLMRYVDRNPRFALRPTTYTHAFDVLNAHRKFTAINAAIEVDLTGQINAEVAGGRYVGAVGGAADFLRGARASRGGLPIVALPATVTGREGTRSRIVTRLSGPTSTARADAGIIVTEYGIADLRGLSLGERRRRMIDIAAPDVRAALEAGDETPSQFHATRA
ncbi:acetyl-CoA hydrolase/transferase family protein [Xanthobacter oligotrophicus]|uniref:acetyl-CoA hydrolase/transferase family protein n=1 Tax=Xanthobacter oligotrophicus TaxID=2607286 RepID=UPI0011F31754|nr:acetyl-CoA hydrolase/transferase C-terminal domain-containing protein [Xanthobacter oligotrophicus]MCG5236190.1 acetyl-CoA hydrolase/transferase family protein [Xanthobacter oligotrophicus]